MDDTPCRLFFSEPACLAQRQYEALRAVFLDGLSQKDAAERFGYSYDAFRQLVHQFRQSLAAGAPPPFSPRSGAAVLRGQSSLHPDSPISPTAPTSAS